MNLGQGLIALAIAVSGALIAAGIFYSVGRYEISNDAQSTGVWRLDKRSGEIVACAVQGGKAGCFMVKKRDGAKVRLRYLDEKKNSN